MKKSAVYGAGFGINGREAAMQATQHALDQMGTARPVLGLALSAQEFDINEVLTGMSSLLGETPLWGASTLCPLTGEGDQPRAVVVALITGSDLQAQVQGYPGFAADSAGAAAQLAAALNQDVLLPQDVLLAADGLQGSLTPVFQALAGLPVSVAGGLASGDPSWGKTFTIAKNQAGAGGLSAAVLGGGFRLGVGLGHGWKDLGVYFHATRARDTRLEMLDNAPAAEMYARYLGYSSGEWTNAPLAEMARLYPLGVEVPDGEAAPGRPHLLVRSALRVESDGALRMSAPVPEGALLHLMTGDPDACLEAAQSAAEDALRGLYGKARPLIALALVDAAWQMLFESRPGQVASVLKSVLGEVPVIGAYTYGQIHRPNLDQAPVLYNQHIEVIVFGQA